jgi:hypothetical protein
MSNTPTQVNGFYPSFVDISADIDGFDLGAELTAISYSDNVDRGEVRGAARQVLGRTRGDYKAEASAEMQLKQYKALRARAGNRFYDLVFPITVNYADTDNDPITTDELVRVRFKKREKDYKVSTDGLTVKLEFDIDGLIEDGQLPFPEFVR